MNWMPAYSIIEKKKNRAQIQMEVTRELDCFRGHFPDFEITPGVVLINWVYVFIQSLFKIQSVKSIPYIKFQKPILPGQIVFLKLDYSEQTKRLEFEYYNKQIIFAKGRIQIGDEE